ncbi:hypothetical protein STCU_10090 [Strigomonas culicis]|uniref:Uncharacterized protein n=1 Tax=Strigomonas culicis TaxID=28005 RepID=S9TNF3_9TRYP|nr:hypothetical protein STCU_10090 [Strigomonas culicis]|eukprot:EPY18259.1 hypothetical protein STCU_10090 [Strigomonas culicis]
MTDTNGKVQRLWLEARCSTFGTMDHGEKMKLFLEVFTVSFRSVNDPNFKVLFGNGKELCNLVCKNFVHSAKHVLSSDKMHALRVTTGGYQINLLNMLSFLVRPSDNVAAMTSTYELYGNHNICALLLMLHGQLLSIASEGPTAGLTEGFSVDRMYLKLLSDILGCPQRDLIRRCVSECVNESAINTVLSTINILYASHVEVPRDIPETALNLFKKQQHLTTVNISLDRIAANLEQTLATTPANKESTSTTLTCLVCLLEAVLLIRQRIRFPPVETLSFGALASALLNMENALAQNSEYAKRLILCIDAFATTPRQEASGAPADKKQRGSFLDLIPRSFNSLKESLAPSSDRAVADEAGLTVCTEVVECLTTLFVCAVKESTIFLYGSELFKLAQMSAKGDLSRYVLDSCRDNFMNLNELQLSFLCNFLFTISDKVDIDAFVGFVMETMLSNDKLNMKK